MAASRRLIHLVPYNRQCGEARYALDLCRAMADRGWSVTVYTPDARMVDRMFRSARISLRHAPLSGLLCMGSARVLASHLRSEPRGTIIHTHRYRDAFIALVARKLARRQDIRIVNTRHRAAPAHDSRLGRRIYRNVSAHIFLSDRARDTFLSTWHGRSLPFDARCISVIPTSINPAAHLLTYEPESGPVTALYHGRVAPGKGLETLIDALPALKGLRTRLRIAGSGMPDYVDTLKRRATALGVMGMIDWAGHPADIHRAIAECHFGVLPTLGHEPWRRANLEYMALGRPHICTFPCDTPDGVIAVPQNDAEALGRAMAGLAADAEKRRSLGAAARQSFLASRPWEDYIFSISMVYAYPESMICS